MDNINRRSFLKGLGLLGAAGMAEPLAMSLFNINNAAAFYAGNDYKALVCVFLLGGNDHANTLVPIDAKNYPTYQRIRGVLALNKADILPLNGGEHLAHGIRYGLHPSLKNLQKIFNNDKKLAVLQNVGMITRPTTKAHYQAQQHLPPKLFSHNDQQSLWESHGMANERSQGWGGKMGRLAQRHNASRTNQLTCVSASGKVKLLSTNTTEQYTVTQTNGSTPLGVVTGWAIKQKYWMGSDVVTQEALKMMRATRSNIFEKEIADTFVRSIDTEEAIASALGPVAPLQTQFANDAFSQSLLTVANLIRAQAQLGMKRQVFFVGLSGFDTHGSQLSTHARLLSELDAGLASFYNAISEAGMSNNVTTFTASEFGRTLANNGDGTDHGWGGHHFIMGGAVKGGFYGQAPLIGVDTEDDVGRGRLIPTTSVDQYVATLAKWFGVEDHEMGQILPYIHNFSTRNLGFL